MGEIVKKNVPAECRCAFCGAIMPVSDVDATTRRHRPPHLAHLRCSMHRGASERVCPSETPTQRHRPPHLTHLRGSILHGAGMRFCSSATSTRRHRPPHLEASASALQHATWRCRLGMRPSYVISVTNNKSKIEAGCNHAIKIASPRILTAWPGRAGATTRAAIS